MSNCLKTKLYIYIPTYNRELEVRSQIKALVQASSNIDKNELVIHVNDNNSKYANESIKLLCQQNNIKFTKNPANIGGNANILLGFVQPIDSDYLWILSDNDIINTSSLLQLFEIIKKKPDLILASSITLRQQNITFDRESNILKLLNHRAGLISSTIYNLKSIQSNIKQAFFFHNSSFPHLAVIFGTIRDNKALKIALVPYKDILKESIEIEDHRGDYRLSYIGFPMLAELLDKRNKKRIIDGWFKENKYNFVLTYQFNKYLYNASLKTIIKHGSFHIKLEAILMNAIKPILIFAKTIIIKSKKRGG